MAPGCAGTAPEVTVKVCEVDAPQVLLAVTVIVPPVAPAVALMLFVVLLPLQPEGKVQV